MAGKLIPDPFIKNQNLASFEQRSEIYSLFSLHVQVEFYQNIKTKVLITCFDFM